MPLPDPLVLIDVETTGANPVGDRVTEIAVLRVERGVVVERWESLVNPERHIPGMIQRMIGITDAMVVGAPTFAQLADRVRTLLEGAVFVAHNARFDYGFICNEYQRIGQTFEAPVLCTVKLSRALYPEYHRHGLDALIARHGFVCDARHRAMGDADVLWQFACAAQAQFPPETLARACERAMKPGVRPPGLPEGMLAGLPDTPGVYLLIGERDVPLYIGKAVSLRARALEHFAGGKRSGREAELIAKVQRVDWQQTAGELSALLLEAALVKDRAPIHNGVPRNAGNAFGLRLMPNRKRPPMLQRVPLNGTDPADWDQLYGVFRSPREADSALRQIADLYQLCLRRIGLETGAKGECAAYRVQRCAGACVGRESAARHDERLAMALRSVAMKAWPWPGGVVVGEHCAHSGLSAWHVVDHWCHLGSADTPQALEALLGALPPRRFDPDTGRLLQRWLSVTANLERVHITPAPGITPAP